MSDAGSTELTGAAARVYLAGPDVFLPDPMTIARRKKALCAEYGFVGVFPLDACLDLSGLDGPSAAARIAAANEGLMRGCDLLIANMTPFRGPGMDGGTAYEMGFMRALGRPVFGYTNSPDPFATRTKNFVGAGVQRRADGTEEDEDGLQIEDFGLADNLMMAAAVTASGGEIAVCSAPQDDLRSFVLCLKSAFMAWRKLPGPK